MKTPQKSYMESAAEIGGMVSELQSFADNLQDRNPDSIQWGHVGDLQHVRATLSELLACTRRVALNTPPGSEPGFNSTNHITTMTATLKPGHQHIEPALSERLKSLRHVRGLSVAEMAHAVGLWGANGGDNLRQMERGVRALPGTLQVLLPFLEKETYSEIHG